MLLTKYEHACMTLEEDGKILVIDPGNFTTDFQVTDNIIAIVITHEHADHFDPNLLASIYDKNPDSVLISLESIVTKMPEHRSQIVTAGEIIHIGPFELEFFGGTHAQIHPDIPLIDNLGIFVNHRLYYPGDSFALPNQPVDILALPVSAPWMKTSEAIDFAVAIKPRLIIPTHDAILSPLGKAIVDRLVPNLTEKTGMSYSRLDGQTLEM